MNTQQGTHTALNIPRFFLSVNVMFAPFSEIFLFLRNGKIFLLFFGDFCKLVGDRGCGIIKKIVSSLPLPGRGLLFARAKRSKRPLKERSSLRILLNDGGVYWRSDVPRLFCISTFLGVPDFCAGPRACRSACRLTRQIFRGSLWEFPRVIR